MERLLVLSQTASRRSQAASDSDATARRQTQTDNDASGNPQRVAGRPMGRPLRMPLRGNKLKLTTLPRKYPSARKKIPQSEAIVGDGQAFPARQVLTNEKRRTVAGTDSCGWASRSE